MLSWVSTKAAKNVGAAPVAVSISDRSSNLGPRRPVFWYRYDANNAAAAADCGNNDTNLRY